MATFQYSSAHASALARRDMRGIVLHRWKHAVDMRLRQLVSDPDPARSPFWWVLVPIPGSGLTRPTLVLSPRELSV
jgi:hypothetical protein